jgi:hypothetical protein
MKVEKSRESVVNDPTLDTRGGVDFSKGTVDNPGINEKIEIVTALQSYMTEADENRRNGMNPRDTKWQQNLDLYWNRFDFSAKAKWQAQETMPEVPNFVDRFAAALKEALIATPDGFFTVSDPSDTENDLAQAVKNIMSVWLTTAGRNQIGQLVPYSAVFEEQMKLGAIMASSSVTTWKNDVPGGRVAVENVDPRFVWLDHTYRNLYRIRRIELDRHELSGMKRMTDNKGGYIFDPIEMSRLEGSLLQKSERDAERTGNSQEIASGRRPIILDEYIATVIGSDGSVLADRALMVIANGSYLIRGPEKNPFWHGKDWLTYTPLVTAPLSVYGRSYMEDFGSVAKTFNDLTNMIIDAVHTSSLKAYAMVPGMLLNPNQINEGISPNKIFLLDDGYRPEDFAKELSLGQLSPDSVRVWESMKSELSNAAGINEIGLGQFAPNSRTSATEITETQQSSSALIRSVAQTVETRYLDPQLDLMWKTGMQHASLDSKMLRQAAGEEMWEALHARRREIISHPFTFQARGISGLISRNQQLKALMGILGVIAQNDVLMQAFLKKIDIEKLVNRIFTLSGVDLSKLTISARDTMIRSITEPMQDAAANSAGAAQPSERGQQEVASAVSALGVGR